MNDVALPPELQSKARRDWGLQNMVAADSAPNPMTMKNDFRQQQVRRKIAQFTQNAVFPMQLTIPRQYATTKAGVSVVKILTDRPVDRAAGGGVRVVVQENAQQARFVVSPLFQSRQDALAWAHTQMGADVSGL